MAQDATGDTIGSIQKKMIPLSACMRHVGNDMASIPTNVR